MFRMLTGQLPFDLRLSTTLLRHQLFSPTPPLSWLCDDLDPSVEGIVLKAMRKEPERRYSSVEAFAEDLRRYQEGRPVLARPSTFAYRADKFVRRNKVAVLAATLVLLAIVAGLIATERQARIARAERAKAEKRFNDVRKLANSNLFEVYPVLENLEGSLKAREAILRNALTYLDSLSKEAGGDVALQSELATAYEKVGDVQGALNNSSLGKTEAGLESYAKAAALRKAVLTEQPYDVEAKKLLTNNVYVSARTLWNDSRTADAEKAFEEALQLQRELIKARPESVEFQNRLAILLIDYGAIPIFNFQADKAIVLFNEALEINRSLRQQTPDDVELKKTRARGLRILSKAKTAFGDYAGGLEALQEAHTLASDLARQFPKDFRLQRSVWLTESMTCELLIDRGDGTEGKPRCEETIAFPKAALQNEPENGVVAYDLAVSHFNAARANRLAHHFAATITQAQAAIEVMTKLSATAPKNSEYKRNLAIYRTEMARAQLELDQPQLALAVLQEVRDTLRPIVEADPGSTTYQYDLGFAHRLAAEASHRTGDTASARTHIDKAIAIFARLKEQKSLRESDNVILQEMEQERIEYNR
jgi:tetratricopeptide (TPR) repeat protein